MLLLFWSGCSSSNYDTPLYEIKLTQTMLGPIQKNTDFSLTALNALLPGFDIQPFSSMSNAKDVLYRVFYHDKEWLQIVPHSDKKKIAEIHVLSSNVKHKYKIDEMIDAHHWNRDICTQKHHKLVCHDKNIKYIYHDDILKSMVLTF